jgi:hypothetical protein
MCYESIYLWASTPTPKNLVYVYRININTTRELPPTWPDLLSSQIREERTALSADRRVKNKKEHNSRGQTRHSQIRRDVCMDCVRCVRDDGNDWTCMMHGFIVHIRDPFILLRLSLTPGETFSLPFPSLSLFVFFLLFDRECSTVIIPIISFIISSLSKSCQLICQCWQLFSHHLYYAFSPPKSPSTVIHRDGKIKKRYEAWSRWSSFPRCYRSCDHQHYCLLDRPDVSHVVVRLVFQVSVHDVHSTWIDRILVPQPGPSHHRNAYTPCCAGTDTVSIGRSFIQPNLTCNIPRKIKAKPWYEAHTVTSPWNSQERTGK